MIKINDIITNEDDVVYAEVAVWCNENNAMLEEIESLGNIRRFKIVQIPDPSYEEQKERRALAYLAEVDPITVHIQRERDEADPDEEKIALLIEERSKKVDEIKKMFPYPEEK